MAQESKGVRPVLKGVAQIKEGDKFYKVGKIALWNNDRKTSKEQPKYRGNVTIDGTKYNIALWEQVEGDKPKK